MFTFRIISCLFTFHKVNCLFTFLYQTAVCLLFVKSAVCLLFVLLCGQFKSLSVVAFREHAYCLSFVAINSILFFQDQVCLTNFQVMKLSHLTKMLSSLEGMMEVVSILRCTVWLATIKTVSGKQWANNWKLPEITSWPFSSLMSWWIAMVNNRSNSNNNLEIYIRSL